MSSPTRIGAFFDLDGTLLPPPSLEWRFFLYSMERGKISGAHLGRWLGHFVRTFPQDPNAATKGNKRYLAGIRESLVAGWASSPRAESIQFFQGGLERVAWHAAQNHRVVLVSGTVAPLACALAAGLLGATGVLATELEAVAGMWTGRTAGEHMSGTQKARAIRAYAGQHDLKLDDSYAYGNEISDLSMLALVGHPNVVNPTARLRRAARMRRWPICDWGTVSATSFPAYGRQPVSTEVR